MNTQLYSEVYSELLSKFVAVVPTAATVLCRYSGRVLDAVENRSYIFRLTFFFFFLSLFARYSLKF